MGVEVDMVLVDEGHVGTSCAGRPAPHTSLAAGTVETVAPVLRNLPLHFQLSSWG